MNLLIVDDEPRAHHILRNYIGKITNLEFVGSCLNAMEAAAWLKNNKADVLLLDITMPEISGFDFLRSIEDRPLVIFTTAHSEYAVESYDYDAVDYLKKPIPFDRFAKAIEKARRWMEKGVFKRSAKEIIEIRLRNKLITIPFREILYFQSMGNYIKIFVSDTMYITKMTTHELEDMVTASSFLRIHKSYIVNKEKILEVRDEYVIIEGNRLPIGKTFKKYVKEFV